MPMRYVIHHLGKITFVDILNRSYKLAENNRVRSFHCNAVLGKKLWNLHSCLCSVPIGQCGCHSESSRFEISLLLTFSNI